MSDFFARQMDYIFFIYGLAFFILGAVSFDLHSHGRRDQSWILLGLFGLLHGINEWLDMAALSIPTDSLFYVIRALFLIGSFVALLEFGRRGVPQIRRLIPASVVHTVLLGMLGACFIGEHAFFTSAVRYSYGFIGGLLAAVALWHRARSREAPASELIVASVAMVGYALLGGLVVAPTPHFPASVVNTTTFVEWTGIPVQCFRAVLATMIAVSIWYHARRSMPLVADAPRRWSGMGAPEWSLLAAMIIVIAGGWYFTNVLGWEADRRERDNLMKQARLAATLVDMNIISRLTASETDTTLPEYLRVKRQLAGIRAADRRYRFSYLTILRDNKAIFLADSEPDTSPDCSPPGQIYTEASNGMLAVLRETPEQVDGPYEDRWGTWVSAYAATPSSGPYLSRVAVGIDVDARDWKSLMADRRLPAILITMMIVVIIIMYHVARERDEAAKEMLVRSERLAAVGSMSAGIAHEFNNALMVIRSHVDLLLRDVLEETLHGRIVVIERQARRASAIVQGVTALARPMQFKSVSCTVASIVDDVLEAQREMLAVENIQVDWRPSDDRWRGDPGGIYQTLTNVITNARHAMKSRGEGRLTLSANRHGDRMLLIVRDTGTGMNAETLQRVFTPFFTTKGGWARDKLGIQGVGLGMSICHRIMEAQGGAITLESVEGKGTSVTIDLPAVG